MLDRIKTAASAALACAAVLPLVPLALGAQAPSPRAAAHEASMTAPIYSLQALAPVLIVDDVDAAVAFWTGRLGFTKENEVPGAGGKLAFASVKKDGIEIMYQSRASVVAESPAQAKELDGRSVALFIMVPSLRDLDVIERQTTGAPVVKPRADTFYGTTEFYIREPGGNVVGFSARK